MTAAAVLIATARRSRSRRRGTILAVLAGAIVVAFVATLCLGRSMYGLDEVWRVILGQDVPGASFTVGTLRLPRAVLGVLAGLGFGMAGTVFQTVLRNPLASPDIVGVSAGASAAAVVGIVVLGWSEGPVAVLATCGAVATAALIYLLANRRGFAGARLILIGIGIAALLQSVISYVLSRAAEWDLQAGMQWLTGSLNGATWARIAPVAIVCVVAIPLLLGHARSLETLRLGDDAARGLGVSVQRTRIVVVLTAVVLLAVTTAATGPIAFVALMAGPIAARVFGAGGSLVLPAGLVGALLVLVADFVGQFAFGTRYPVGVVTGVLGAPFLLYLLVRTHRAGGSL